jgi:hypothetical protein
LFAELEIHVIIEKCEDNLRILIFNMPSRQKNMTVKSDGICVYEKWQFYSENG